MMYWLNTPAKTDDETIHFVIAKVEHYLINEREYDSKDIHSIEVVKGGKTAHEDPSNPELYTAYVVFADELEEQYKYEIDNGQVYQGVSFGKHAESNEDEQG
ncbi:hypothetical protein M3212_00730 [Alkalihalobacillus oceani]|uniref:hypothetical protein n=1 Tax=Halalkalibacter oceani TaxID=1653776 RepID=UPI00203F277F|nr:hypothetical protein [Halalkalibacter oceani]MCM3759301.1 hypothetical protein [Halalkalibacter oceani]